MKNCPDYTMICMHNLLWGIVLEVSNEIAKILIGDLQQWVEKQWFCYWHQCINTYETARARHIKLVDERIGSLKSSTLVAQAKYILILIVNDWKQIY